MSHLWRIVVSDIRIVRMASSVILVIGLCRIEGFQRHDLSHDLPRENLSMIELGDVGFRNSLLFVAVVKNRRAILRPLVRTLPIQLRGIVCD